MKNKNYKKKSCEKLAEETENVGAGGEQNENDSSKLKLGAMKTLE